jgi:hypothetical protein
LLFFVVSGVLEKSKLQKVFFIEKFDFLRFLVVSENTGVNYEFSFFFTTVSENKLMQFLWGSRQAWNPPDGGLSAGSTVCHPRGFQAGEERKKARLP